MRILFSFILFISTLFAGESSWGLDWGNSINGDSYSMSLGLNQTLSSELGIELYESIDFPFHQAKVLHREGGRLYQMNAYHFHLGLGLRHVFPLGETLQLENSVGVGYFPGFYSGTSMSPEFRVGLDASSGLRFGFGDVFGLRVGYRYQELYPLTHHYAMFDLSFDF